MAIFDDYITLREAGSISGYHPDYIGALIRSNKVKGKKIGKNWYVSRKEVREYLATKHYVPASMALSSLGKKALIILGCIVLVGACVAYATSGSSRDTSSAPVQVDLNDKVVPQGSVALPVK